MDSGEYLKWAKARALQYLDNGDLQQALASITSDLMKRAEFMPVIRGLAPIGLVHVLGNDAAELRQFIEGLR